MIERFTDWLDSPAADVFSRRLLWVCVGLALVMIGAQLVRFRF